ncbi:MAG: peroxiredoxin Q/BCP [Pseudohongiellaceae bacterium]|jgi:peroxiredoxin Q/BCP
MKKTITLALLFLWSIPSYCLEVGSVAPNFTLQGSDGQTYKLSDFRGKESVVLAWFPKAFTGGCTIECKSLAENGHLLKNFTATYFMASVDPIEKNIDFAKQQKADFPLLSDPTKKTAQEYGVLRESGTASRHTFYIGRDGKILAIDKNVKPATSAQDMAKMLAELKTPLAGK